MRKTNLFREAAVAAILFLISRFDVPIVSTTKPFPGAAKRF